MRVLGRPRWRRVHPDAGDEVVGAAVQRVDRDASGAPS